MTEANCSRQMTQGKKTILHQIFEFKRRVTKARVSDVIVIVWLDLRVEGDGSNSEEMRQRWK